LQWLFIAEPTNTNLVFMQFHHSSYQLLHSNTMITF